MHNRKSRETKKREIYLLFITIQPPRTVSVARLNGKYVVCTFVQYYNIIS